MKNTVKRTEKRDAFADPAQCDKGIINRFPNHFEGGNMYLLAGRPAMGKTVVAVRMAEDLAKTKRVLYVYTEGTPSFDPSEFLFDFMCFTTVSEIIRRMVKTKYDAVIIDSFQYLRNYSLNDTAYMLSWAAKKEDTAVIILSNLSRKCERRKDKRPKYSDLRNKKMCGYLAKYSDEILFLYRDAYYFTGKENVMEFIAYDKRWFKKRYIRKAVFDEMIESVYPEHRADTNVR